MEQVPARIRANTIARKLKAGEDCFGVCMRFASDAVVEIAGTVGCDFAIVDMEHEALGLAAAASMIRTADLCGMTPIARVGRRYETIVDPLLSAGAQGFCLARVRTRQDVERLVEAVMYHPLGNRTVYGIGRSGFYGHGIDEDQWAADANDGMYIEIVIEEAEALENLDAILSHPRVNAVQFGPKDLRQSLGMPPAERLAEILGDAARRVEAHGLSISRSIAGPVAPRASGSVPRNVGDMLVAAPTGLLVGALSKMAQSIRQPAA
ncbi:aldolase/citrate lyase family protein [Aquabacter sp. CN5-332]|uniref:HpcH/HpaI aldolase family protein n=1 Tax=Aquabacter sp. CN5-332 TaxID=3156608 RepID=UPI0032B59C93